MIVLTGGQAASVGIVLAAWLAAAAWALWSGLKMRRRAATASGGLARLTRLLEGAPALPLTISADGRVTAPARLADWLGLDRLPHLLVDFAKQGAGLDEADVAALANDTATTQRSGRSFQRVVQPVGSSRKLLLSGARMAGRATGVIIWVHDATGTQAELDRLGEEVGDLTRAFSSLSRLIEAAPIPMWHRGPDLRLMLVNRAYVEAVDATDSSDVIARGLELVETSGGVAPISAAAAARDANEVRSREVPATIAGQRRSVRIVDVPLGEAGVAGYAIDNEELERARATLRRFVQAQRDALDRLSAGVAQFAQDRSLTFSNAPFQRIFALKPEWIADRPEFDRVLERMRESGRIPEARDFPAWKAERRAWFLASSAVEETWLLPGGTYLRVVAQPVPDGGVLLIFEDRTEQIQLASARDTLLRVREATFDNLFEAVGVFAADGRLHLWNNRFRDVWGFDEALLASHPRVDALAQAAAKTLTTPSRASLIRELVRAATVERTSRSGRVALKDGRHFEFAAVPLPDGNALFTMLDITDSRRVERVLRDRADALEAADKVKTAFVANMSYQLRTPLTSIGGFAEMMAKGYAGELSLQARDYVGGILESVAKLSELVNDVLQLTQADAGLLAVDRETVDLLQVLDSVAAQHMGLAEDKAQALVIDLESSAGRVEGDARQLREAVSALLHNAIKYTHNGGRVLLHATGDGDGATIVVSDNGPGMEHDMQARVLDGIAHDDEAIGLPLAQQIVEAHGGTLSLLSEAGAGTVVTLKLVR